MKVDYKKEYKKKVAENLNDVLLDLDSSNKKKKDDITTKIKNWANKFNFSFKEIKDKILKDEIFKCVFAKDPSRQKFHENLAAKYIKNLDLVENFEMLPSAGKNAIYLTKGKLFKGDKLKNKPKDTKSIDFKWNTGKYTIYASHKYTDISGGSQDNQYKDIQEFLDNAIDCNEKNSIFIAICDGNYYLKRDASTNDETKIKRLERKTNNKTTFVKTIETLYEF
jgi:hypothetical protein